MRQRIENWPTNYAVASDEFGEVKRSKTRDYVTSYNGHLFVYGHTNTYDIQPRGGMDSHWRVYEELAMPMKYNPPPGTTLLQALAMVTKLLPRCCVSGDRAVLVCRLAPIALLGVGSV